MKYRALTLPFSPAIGFLTIAFASICLLALAGAAGRKQFPEDADHDAIQYRKRAATDAITKLQADIDAGRVKLLYNKRNGYLNAVLTHLNVPFSSQTLVFSKTSFQRERISPRSPRALYFNDGVWVGWVQDGPVLEFAAQDPELGTIFYTLDQSSTGKPRFVRQSDECLQCHSSTMTSGVPGYITRSVYARIDGQPELREGSFLTDETSPMEERWGGWYVTGRHGTIRHMGNEIARGPDGQVMLYRERGANVTDLSDRFDTSPYLTGHSDIVALLVAEHQNHVQNLLTKLNYQTRMGMDYDAMLNRELKQPEQTISNGTRGRVRSAGEALLKALLFSGETELTSPIVGSSGYSEQFSQRGPFDTKGRSLRQFDLKKRLFRYPCSYLIYSPQFDALPSLAKNTLFARLWEVLSGKETGKAFAHLSRPDREAIREILLDTKPDFAKWVKEQTAK